MKNRSAVSPIFLNFNKKVQINIAIKHLTNGFAGSNANFFNHLAARTNDDCLVVFPFAVNNGMNINVSVFAFFEFFNLNSRSMRELLFKEIKKFFTNNFANNCGMSVFPKSMLSLSLLFISF